MEGLAEVGGEVRRYLFVKRLADSLVKLQWSGGTDLWTKGFVRGRPKSCAVFETTIKPGTKAWHPITNGYNRMDRISNAGILRLEENCETKKRIVKVGVTTSA